MKENQQPTTEQLAHLQKIGISDVDIFYLSNYGITYSDLIEMTPQQVSELSDMYAQQDELLLGC